MSAVARRYARAAVLAAQEQGGRERVDAVLSSLRGFHAAYQTSGELREILHNPALISAREQVLAAVVAKLAMPDEAAKLLHLLVGRARIEILPHVVTEVETIADELAGRLRAYVTSVIPLTDAQEKRLSEALSRRVGVKVVLSAEVAPEILGGLVCRVGDLTLDGSLSRQLANLRELI